MQYSSIFWWTMLWIVFWGVTGGIGTRRVYLRKDRDTSNATLGGSLIGAAFGPFGLAPLWWKSPEIGRVMITLSSLVVIGIIAVAFANADPENNCVSNGSFVASQITNGLIIGIIYGLMAMGLTLIFSILGLVSFAHGAFYMIGGMLVYYIVVVWFPGVHPLIGVLGSCSITFLLGALFERLFLTPMYDGRVERPVEYGILVTFGLSFTLTYLVAALAGFNPVKVKRFFDFPRIRLPDNADPWLIKTSRGNMTLFDTVSISNPRFVAAILSILVLLGLLYFLHRTWTGKGLRAVSQDREAAAIAGINPNRMNMLAFALGCMIAALSGAVSGPGLFLVANRRVDS
ncbi:MAG: branched-chain amino acid ABC transporter permease [Arenicellales bacterium]